MRARFLVDRSFAPGERVELHGDEMHHALRVVRVRLGEEIEIFDGKGAGAEAIVVEAGKSRVEIEVGKPVAPREAPLRIVLAAALIAPDKFELVLQKGCELGVTRFVPLVTQRTETRPERVRGKLDRWQRILLEATKQCGRTVLPLLDEPCEFDDLVTSQTGLVLFDADAAPDPWPQPPRAEVTLVIGPEGGLTPDELSRARAAGATVCSLGPRRLRAETAAIAAVTLAGSFLGDLTPREPA